MDVMQIDVMVADASHEVYVDTILDTIREAAKKRGTGIAEEGRQGHHRPERRRVCRIHLYRKLGQQTVCGHVGPHRPPQIPRHRIGQAYQAGLVPPGSPALALGQDIQPDQRRGSDEDEHRTGLRACHLQRTDGRRGLLERLRGLHQPRHPRGQETQVLHLHGNAV